MTAGDTVRSAEAVSVLGSRAMRGPLQDLLRSRGMRLEHWEHLRSHHRPGGTVAALYRVRCSRPGAEAPLTLHIGAATGTEEEPAGPHATRALIAGISLQLWLHPHDPVLLSLPWACDGAAVGADVFSAAEPASLRLVAYRPLRRAVVQAHHTAGDAYLKLLPPADLPLLRRRHRLLEAAGVPAPPLLPVAPQRDVAVLGALPGTSLFHLLAADGASKVGPQTLLEVLESLPHGALALPRKRSWAERAGDYAGAAAAALPARATEIRALAGAVAEAVAGTPAGPLVPVHGDFHEGNLLLSGGTVTGLLDVDALGPGHRVDDLACLIGHLAVLSAANPGRPQLADALLDYRREFETAVEPAALYARSAGVVLTLVAGARAGHGLSRQRSAELRLETVQRLLGWMPQ